MRALDLGAGVREVLARPGSGRVLATYRAGAYLRLPGGLIALTGPDAPPGPVHLRVPALPPLRTGETVSLGAQGHLWASCSVRLDVPTWVGELPAAAIPGGVSDAQRRVLHTAARHGGRGPGLTPSGDDALAGVLLATRALGGLGAEPELVAVARGVVTTDIAAAYLLWAARGQCIEPAHAWLAAASGGESHALDRAGERVRGLGASSGQALLDGLRRGYAGFTGTAAPSDTEIQTASAVPGPGLVQW